MLNELNRIKDELRKLKEDEIKKIRKFDSKIDINSIIKKYISFQHDINENNNSKNLRISRLKTGIFVQSNLKNKNHEYLYLQNKNQKKEIIGHLVNIKNPFIEIHFLGSKIGEIDVELHLILYYENGEKESNRLRLGQTKIIRINKIVTDVQVAIRVKGSGNILFNDPILVIGNQRKNKVEIKVKPKKIKDMEVIFIADEFTTKCFQEEFKIIPITPENWEIELNNKNPDLFFCESAWLGNNGSWKNKVGNGGPRDHTILLEVIKWCNSRNIPTIFWNKEDPFHYHAFIETAKHFDFVFTTDQNSVEQYKKDGCDHVFTLPFAAQPKLHNPIEKYERKNKVVFAGAYYGNKFPERKKAMDNMIKISGKYGLEIFDRNLNNPESPNQFPQEFKNYIVGTLRPEEIDIAYKGYKVALNVNSIVDSPTMFSRRVFEILASNTPVVSSESLGMSKFFGDLLTISSDFNVLKEGIKKYFTDELYYKKNRLMGLRRVFEKHTYKHRVEEMLNCINFPFIKENPKISFIGIVKSYNDFENILKIYKEQSVKNKHLIILLDIFEGYLEIFNNNNNDKITTYILDYIHHYPTISDMIKSDFIIPLSHDHLYGPNYARDLFIATQYTEDTVIVKGVDQEYVFTTGGYIDNSLIPTHILSFLSPDSFVKMLEENKKMDDWFRFGVSFFNIDNFNLIKNYKENNNIELEKSIYFV